MRAVLIEFKLVRLADFNGGIHELVIILRGEGVWRGAGGKRGDCAPVGRNVRKRDFDRLRPAIGHIHESLGKVQERVVRIQLRIEGPGVVPFDGVRNFHGPGRARKRKPPGLLVEFVPRKK